MIDLAWPIVAFTLIILGNIRLKQWLDSKQPLNLEQYNELTVKVGELQKHVSSLALNAGMKARF